MNKIKLNKEQTQRIIDLYTNHRKADGKPYYQIDLAAMFDVSASTIGRCLRDADIDCTARQGFSNRKLTSEQIQEIVRLYTTRKSDGSWTGSIELGRKFGVSDSAIRYHLHSAGIKLRSFSEAIAGKACKPITRLPPDNEQPPLCKCNCGQQVEWSRNKNRWYAYIKGHRLHRLYHNKEWLEREYVEKKRSSLEIAAQFGVSPFTIRFNLRKLKIPIRPLSESLALASDKKRGPNNPAWKGGVADWDYSYDWKALCKCIKDRDGWTCQLCSKRQSDDRSKALHVHHIDENKLNNHPHNLITLCTKCHHPIHGKHEIRLKLVKIAQRNEAASHF